VIVLIAGLVVALGVYVIAIVGTLRSVIAWQRGGEGGQARAAAVREIYKNEEC